MKRRVRRWKLDVSITAEDRQPDLASARTRDEVSRPSAPDADTDAVVRLGWSGALEPLTQAVLMRRSLETSPAGYLGIVSIIQGVALALLTEQTHDRIASRSAPLYVILTQSLTLLLILAFIFHFYTVTSVLFRWPPSFMDALVPFIIGPFEIAPAYYLGTDVPWSVAIAALCGISVIALAVTALYTPKEHFGIKTSSDPAVVGRRQNAAKHFKRTLIEAVGTLVITASLTLALSSIAHDGGDARWQWTTAAAVVVLAGFLGLVTTIEYRLVRVYDAYGIERKMFS